MDGIQFYSLIYFLPNLTFFIKGKIDSSDLFIILKQMVGENMDDTQIQQLVETTITEADVLDGDGALSFEEFKNSMSSEELHSILTIDF